MGLAWQQGPLAPGAVGRFLVPDPLPERMLYAEPLRRRMRVRFCGAWIASSEDVMLLHEPGRYPVAYFPADDIVDGVLEPGEHTTRHQDLGPTSWYTVRAGTHSKPRAAWQHTELPGYASMLKGRIAFAWRAMDAFYEEERVRGHPAAGHLLPGRPAAGRARTARAAGQPPPARLLPACHHRGPHPGRPVLPETDRWSPSPAAASPRPSRRTGAACLASPTPATSPPAGAAGPASAIPAPRPCCPATSPTSRTRWSLQPTGRCSSAAPGPAPTSSWTCRRQTP
jgi:uncharacterized protein (DUF427 family)